MHEIFDRVRIGINNTPTGSLERYCINVFASSAGTHRSCMGFDIGDVLGISFSEEIFRAMRIEDPGVPTFELARCFFDVCARGERVALVHNENLSDNDYLSRRRLAEIMPLFTEDAKISAWY